MIKQHASIRRALSRDLAESLPPPELIGRRHLKRKSPAPVTTAPHE